MKRLLYPLCIGMLLLIGYSLPVVAQDLHFSQFFHSPLSTNPANTGFIPDADYRLGVQYRSQYSSIMTIPYKTMSVYGDAQLFRDKLENGWLGIGGMLLSDVAGSGSLRSTKIYGSLAYHQMLANSSLLSAGFNVGYTNKRIDPTNLKFPDQFDGKFFDGSLPTEVVFTTNNIGYVDIQAGLNYAYFPNENTYINAGYSIHHVNQPKESFFDDATAGNIPMRHIGFVNASLKVNPNLIINPNVFYTNQKSASSLVLGLFGQINLSESGEKQLLGGLYYRVGDAAIPMLGIQLNRVRFAFTYDATLSSLKNFNNYMGAYEMSLTRYGYYPDRPDRQSLCPGF